MYKRFSDYEFNVSDKLNSIFMLGDNTYFKSELTKAISKNFSSSCIIDSMNLKKDIKQVKYKPLFSKKWLIRLDYNKLKTNDKELLLSYIAKPSKYVILLVDVSNYKSRKSLLRRKKFIDSETIGLIDFQYPPREYLKNYVKKFLKPKKLSSANAYIIVRRLADKYEMYPTYLNLLRSLPDNEITDKIISNCVDDYSSYGIDRLISMMVLRNRKTLPIRALKEMLADNEPNFILNMLRMNFRYIIEAKYYRNKGLLIPDGFIEKDRSYIINKRREMEEKALEENSNKSEQQETQTSKYKKKGLLNLSLRRINRYLKLAENITNKELAFIYSVLDTKKRVSNDEVGESTLYSMVLVIMNRRNPTEVRKEQFNDKGKRFIVQEELPTDIKDKLTYIGGKV